MVSRADDACGDYAGKYPDVARRMARLAAEALAEWPDLRPLFEEGTKRGMARLAEEKAQAELPRATKIAQEIVCYAPEFRAAKPSDFAGEVAEYAADPDAQAILSEVARLGSVDLSDLTDEVMRRV
jgi:hypothetical protein